jgi:hypothetical protein
MKKPRPSDPPLSVDVTLGIECFHCGKPFTVVTTMKACERCNETICSRRCICNYVEDPDKYED